MRVPLLLMFYTDIASFPHTVTIKYALKDIEMFLDRPSISAHVLLDPAVWTPNFIDTL